jgi:GNAT superfamily N-acetyltransferase
VRRELGNGFELDDDRGRIDVRAVHRYLSEESYWARGRELAVQAELVRTAGRVVGLYHGEQQIGFCRAFSDGVACAYLADVYVLREYQGRGLGTELVREMVERGPFRTCKWILHTEDAHGLYRKLGFEQAGSKVMERGALEEQPRVAPLGSSG